MRKNMKHKSRIVIFVIIAFISIFTIISCKPWPEIIKGVGIWGKSRYGEAVFGEERKGTPGEALGSPIDKEDLNLWK
jgi:hypothetical protein